MRLSKWRSLIGDTSTEAGWRLLTTPIRLGPVCHVRFKCSLRYVTDPPNPSSALRGLYAVPGISETVNMKHFTRHDCLIQRQPDPVGIVPIAPAAQILL